MPFCHVDLSNDTIKMEASETKRVNSILNIIGVNSLNYARRPPNQSTKGWVVKCIIIQASEYFILFTTRLNSMNNVCDVYEKNNFI